MSARALPLRLWCRAENALAGRERGQGTVEYIGLLLAVGALLVAVSTQMKGGLAAGFGHRIAASMQQAVEIVGGAPKAH